MQYDEMENLEYIGKIINYLNRNKKLDPEAFIEFLEGLLDRQAAYIKGDEAVIPQVQPTASAPGYKKAAAALEHPVKTAERMLKRLCPCRLSPMDGTKGPRKMFRKMRWI